MPGEWVNDVYYFQQKYHSLLGYFLHAPLHYTKNTPTSQGENPFGNPSGIYNAIGNPNPIDQH